MNEHLSPDLLIDYLHGELAPEDDALALAHLTACAACRREAELESAFAEALRKQAKAEEVEMPSLVKAAVWEQIREAKPGFAASVAAWFRPALALPIAALVVVGAFFAAPLAHRESPTVDALYYLQAHAAQTESSPLSAQAAPPALETSLLRHGTAPFLAAVEPSLAEAGGLVGYR